MYEIQPSRSFGDGQVAYCDFSIFGRFVVRGNLLSERELTVKIGSSYNNSSETSPVREVMHKNI